MMTVKEFLTVIYVWLAFSIVTNGQPPEAARKLFPQSGFPSTVPQGSQNLFTPATQSLGFPPNVQTNNQRNNHPIESMPSMLFKDIVDSIISGLPFQNNKPTPFAPPNPFFPPHAPSPSPQRPQLSFGNAPQNPQQFHGPGTIHNNPWQTGHFVPPPQQAGSGNPQQFHGPGMTHNNPQQTGHFAPPPQQASSGNNPQNRQQFHGPGMTHINPQQTGQFAPPPQQANSGYTPQNPQQFHGPGMTHNNPQQTDHFAPPPQKSNPSPKQRHPDSTNPQQFHQKRTGHQQTNPDSIRPQQSDSVSTGSQQTPSDSTDSQRTDTDFPAPKETNSDSIGSQQTDSDLPTSEPTDSDSINSQQTDSDSTDTQMTDSVPDDAQPNTSAPDSYSDISSAPQNNSPSSTIPSSCPLNGLRIVCIFNNCHFYKREFRPMQIEPQLCTHINYEFAMLDPNTYEMTPGEPYLDIDEGFYQETCDLKQRNPDLKVLISLGGWGDSTGKYSRLVADPQKRANFIDKSILFLLKYGFDGLDFAWEYPNCWQGNLGVSPKDKKNFATLLQEMKEKFQRKSLVLTVSVSGIKREIEAAYDVPRMSSIVDYINVMTYDMHGPWERKTGHHVQREAMPNDSDPYCNVKGAMQAWIEKGADKKKLNMGLASYGRTFKLKDPNKCGMGAPSDGVGDPGPITREGGILNYNEICDYKNSSSWTEKEDKYAGVYMYSGDQWVCYDPPRMMAKKAKIVIDSDFGGVIIKDLSGDDCKGDYSNATYPLIKSVVTEMMRKDDKAFAEESSKGPKSNCIIYS